MEILVTSFNKLEESIPHLQLSVRKGFDGKEIKKAEAIHE